MPTDDIHTLGSLYQGDEFAFYEGGPRHFAWDSHGVFTGVVRDNEYIGKFANVTPVFDVIQRRSDL